MSQGDVIKCFLQSNRDLLGEFKESNSVLMQHLQVQPFHPSPRTPPTTHSDSISFPTWIGMETCDISVLAGTLKAWGSLDDSAL